MEAKQSKCLLLDMVCKCVFKETWFPTHFAYVPEGEGEWQTVSSPHTHILFLFQGRRGNSGEPGFQGSPGLQVENLFCV